MRVDLSQLGTQLKLQLIVPMTCEQIRRHPNFSQVCFGSIEVWQNSSVLFEATKAVVMSCASDRKLALYKGKTTQLKRLDACRRRQVGGM